ncbi:MAG: hypothetical protein ACRDFB_10345 [Rhabdochlamydiaceae bacterium]
MTLQFITQLHTFSLNELILLKEETNLEIDKKIKTIYEMFANTVGATVIDSIPLVAASTLKLDEKKIPDHLHGIVKPSYLGQHPAVRCIMGDDYPVIAMNIELLSTIDKVEMVITELVFRTSFLTPDKNSCDCALLAMTEEGVLLSSYLSSRNMSKSKMERVKELLEGKTLPLTTSSYLPNLNEVRLIRLQKKV